MDYPTNNPENKYDDGNKPRATLLAAMDDYGADLIGRGVFVGWQDCIEGSVQPQHRDWIGRRDGLFMLDGGGHAWIHEIDQVHWEESISYDRLIGFRQVRLLRPQHEASMEDRVSA